MKWPEFKSGDYLLCGFKIMADGLYRDVYKTKRRCEFQLIYGGVITTVWVPMRRGFWGRMKHYCLWVLNLNVDETVYACDFFAPHLISDSDNMEFVVVRKETVMPKHSVILYLAMNGISKIGVDTFDSIRTFTQEIEGRK